MTQTTTRRGSSNRNERGSSTARRIRRAWLMSTYPSNVPGFSRCYRCGVLLYNPDNVVTLTAETVRDLVHDGILAQDAKPLTIDRILPGVHGGRYTRDNIRPACGPCNSETGGGLRG